MEVARSIAKDSEGGGWFGASSYKWNKLVEYANNDDDTKNLPQLCTTFYYKGLFEWRLSTEAAVNFLRHLQNGAFYEISYDEFLDEPGQAVSKILDFIGVNCNPDIRTYVTDRVARKSSKLDSKKISDKELIIGGKLLPLSIGRGGLIKHFS